MVTDGGLFGLRIGSIQYLLNYLYERQSRGLCMCSAAFCTLDTMAIGVHYVISRNQQAINLRSIKGRSTPYLMNLLKVDVDDWCLLGGVLGIA